MMWCLFVLLVQAHGSMLQPIEQFQNKTAAPKKKILLGNILSDPKRFVEEAAKLDPEAVQNIITLLEGLKTSSENTEQNLVDTLKARTDEAVITGNAIADAEDAVNNAKNAVSDAEGVVTDKKGILVTKESDLIATRETHRLKKAEEKAAQDAHDDQKPGLDSEQEVLKNVIEMLHGLIGTAPGGPVTYELFCQGGSGHNGNNHGQYHMLLVSKNGNHIHNDPALNLDITTDNIGQKCEEWCTSEVRCIGYYVDTHWCSPDFKSSEDCLAICAQNPTGVVHPSIPNRDSFCKQQCVSRMNVQSDYSDADKPCNTWVGNTMRKLHG